MALCRRSHFKDFSEEGDIQSVFDTINAFTEPLALVVVTSGVAVSLAHKLEFVPRMAFQVVTPTTTGTGVVYPGGGAWTTTTVSLTATVAGTYHVILRR